MDGVESFVRHFGVCGIQNAGRARILYVNVIVNADLLHHSSLKRFGYAPVA